MICPNHILCELHDLTFVTNNLQMPPTFLPFSAINHKIYICLKEDSLILTSAKSNINTF